MMKVAVLSVTEEGAQIADFIAQVLKGDLYIKESGISYKNKGNTFTSLSKCVKELFYSYRGLIFVMSLGIVNRVIAPLIKSKYTDPAVVTVDEVGRFAISTLSGHEGGANELCFAVSSITGATPVVTTASEANRTYVCGVGSRKGITKKQVLEAIFNMLKMAGVDVEDLRCLTSAWAKEKEMGILEAARELELSVRFLPKWLIDLYYDMNPEAERSDRVYEAIGVYGVSEPCACLSAQHPKILIKKARFNGVTVTLVKETLLDRHES